MTNQTENVTKLIVKHIGGRDLAVDFKCTCPSELFKGSKVEHLMKETIHLYGYNDANFWNNVNNEPRDFNCKCGKKYTQQWFANGYVEIREVL